MMCMTAELTIPVNAFDYIDSLEKRIRQELWDSILLWARSVRALAQWEDQHLLDNPIMEVLEEHRRLVERQIALGKLISVAAEHPDFSNTAAREQVAATMSILQDKISLWHATMSSLEADRILSEVFPESRA
jgi:hypothetical protein